MDAYKHFSDPEWDGEPVEEIKKEFKTETGEGAVKEPRTPYEPTEQRKTIKIKLRDGKEREIQHMISTSFWSADGKPVSVEEFLQNIFGDLPEFFKSEEELRKIWANPTTRKTFLNKIADLGYGRTELETLRKMIDAEESDLFDVLAYVSFAKKPITRTDRAEKTKENILNGLDDKQQEFLEFVLDKYIDQGVEELDEEQLPILLNLKYNAIADAEEILGGVDKIRLNFFELQKCLYEAKSRR